jgi:hypothetical protein
VLRTPARLNGTLGHRNKAFPDMALELDALLRVRGPEVTFHDSWITSIAIDYRAASADLRFDVPVGSEGNSYIYESGTLTLRGLLFIAIEPPNETPAEGGGVCPLGDSGWRIPG